VTLIEVWCTGNPGSWEYLSHQIKTLWGMDKHLFRKEVDGPFCYLWGTINPATAAQGVMKNVWGATKWRFIEKE
jgi:hypothetical protein